MASKVIISLSKDANADLKIVLDGLNFLHSYWLFDSANIEIINCQAALLILELRYLTYAIIQNCTFGNWTFKRVRNATIKKCNNIFNEGLSTALNFINSSAYVENITIEHEIITGISIDNYSLVHVKKSKFVNNTVRHGVIKILKSSSVIISNCTVLGNYATEYPGVIYANESFLQIRNTYFYGNTAINGGGAILMANMATLQIKNCTFKNNSVNETFGIGGAIVCLNNSFLNASCSIFNHNKAYQGGAIYQKASKMRLNQCFILENSENAIAAVVNSEISIINSVFKNNLAKRVGGALVVIKSVLNVLSTTFENNAQISASHKDVYRPIISRDGGEQFIFSTQKETSPNHASTIILLLSVVDQCWLSLNVYYQSKTQHLKTVLQAYLGELLPVIIVP